ncbi:hypothetical protein T492DRAFT_870017 [Pavlovales sp. CCMP2436]|nr:hypothetical protein T492DRAFT_870017 [Pavlovales sp. CCMP2436]
MLGESVLGRLVWKAMELIRKDFMWRAEDGALTQLMLAADSAEVNAANKTLQHAVWTFTEQLIAEGPQ